MTKLSDILLSMRQKFQSADIDDFEAKALLSGLLDLSTLDLATKPDLVLDDEQVQLIQDAISQRLCGMPVYRILGWREFYGLQFELSKGTLEPRPDTEILVEQMLPYVRTCIERKGNCRILDLGTGTGAIALSLLHHCAGAVAVGVDQSDDALATAERNAEKLNLLNRFQTIKSNWTEQLDGQFDIVVSNPPYIATDIVDQLSPEVKDHDPLMALDGGVDGLSAYRHLSVQLKPFLHTDSVIGFEIGFDQNDSVSNIFKKAGFGLLGAHKDLSGHDRVVIFALTDR